MVIRYDVTTERAGEVCVKRHKKGVVIRMSINKFVVAYNCRQRIKTSFEQRTSSHLIDASREILHNLINRLLKLSFVVFSCKKSYIPYIFGLHFLRNSYSIYLFIYSMLSPLLLSVERMHR